MTNKFKYNVSVVMSVYNGENFVKQAIDSILNQSYSNFKFIIVDDASTDNTWQILNKYAKNDKRIKLLKNKHNIGLTLSLNEAIGIAKGDYIARMDADDISNTTRLEEQIEILNRKHNIGITASWVEIIDENDNSLIVRKLPPIRYVKKHFKFENLICHGSAMFRKNIFDELSGYNPKLRYGQDRDLWQRMFDLGYDLYIIPKLLYKFRISASNISITKKNVFSEKHKTAKVFNSRQTTWLSSLYLQQKKTKEANQILKHSLFTKPNFVMKIIYFLVSFLPQDFVVFFMFTLRPRMKFILKSLNYA